MTSFLELRKLTGRSRAEVARELGITERSLYSIEKGRSTPRRLTVLALASYYGVEVDQITGGQPAVEPAA